MGRTAPPLGTPGYAQPAMCRAPPCVSNGRHVSPRPCAMCRGSRGYASTSRGCTRGFRCAAGPCGTSTPTTCPRTGTGWCPEGEGGSQLQTTLDLSAPRCTARGYVCGEVIGTYTHACLSRISSKGGMGTDHAWVYWARGREVGGRCPSCAAGRREPRVGPPASQGRSRKTGGGARYVRCTPPPMSTSILTMALACPGLCRRIDRD